MSWEVAALGAQAAGSIFGGIGARRQAQDQARQTERQRLAVRIRGMEEETALADELNRTMSTFYAARGANNLSISSPTGLVIAGDIRRYARQNILTVRRNTAMQAGQLQDQAQGLARQGQYSLMTGVFSAAKPLLSLAQTGFR